MKLILPYIAFFLLALTKDLETASADNLRSLEEGPTQTKDGHLIHLESRQVHRKVKGKGKGKGGDVRILGCAP